MRYLDYRLTTVLLLAFLAAPLGAPTAAAQQTATTPDRLMDRFARAWTADAAEVVAEMYAEDAVVFDAGTTFRGRDAIMAYFEGSMAGTGEMEITSTRSGREGAMAYQMGRWTLGTDQGLAEGKHTFIFRQDGGTWRVETAHVESADAQDPADDPVGASVRAAEGEPIAIWVNHVRAEQRDQFEDYLETFWQTGDAAIEAGRLTGADAEAYRNVRVLTPAEASDDGTYPYVFLADPFVEGANYEMLDLLRLGHDAAEAQRLYEQYRETLARPQESRYVQQGAY